MSTGITRQYRRRPVLVEAARLTEKNVLAVAQWCGGARRVVSKASDPNDVRTYLEVPTLAGVITANIGDWVVRLPDGRFSRSSAEQFDATYVPASDRPEW